MLRFALVVLLALNVNGYCDYRDPREDPRNDGNRLINHKFEWDTEDGKTVVPYFIMPGFNQYAMEIIKSTIEEIKAKTPCIEFIEQEKQPVSEEKHLLIKNLNIHNCRSGLLGRVRTAYPIRYLEMSRDPCGRNDISSWSGILLHEMFHVFRIMHTQKRDDRYKYIRLHRKNIKNIEQFTICPEPRCEYPDWSPYECNSIMHYENKVSAIDKRKDTITTKNPTLCRQEDLDSPNNIPTENDWKLLKWAAKCEF